MLLILVVVILRFRINEHFDAFEVLVGIFLTVKNHKMKNYLIPLKTRLFTTIGLLCFSVMSFAQGLDIDIDINEKEWYENPWIYVGAAAFIIILVLLTRKRKTS